MLLMFALQLAIAVSAIMLLRIQRIRDYLVAAAALASRITVPAARILFGYGLACLGGLAVIITAFLLGLLCRAVHLPGLGNFIITAAFTLIAVALGLITLAFSAITDAAAHAVLRVRSALAAADTATGPNPNWEDMFAQLRTQFPDQAGLISTIEKAKTSWLAGLFDTTGIKAILALPHTVAFDTIEALTRAAGKLFWFVTAAALWVAIGGFVAMWLPDSTDGFWVVAVPYGLLILIAVGAFKGDEWCQSHKLPEMWWTGYRLVRWGVRFAVVAAICTTAYTAIDPPQTFSHWMVGIQTRFRRGEEESAKNHFGARYDQNIQRVIETGAGYRVEKRFFGDKEMPVAVRINELLWKTGSSHQRRNNGVYYAEYWRQTLNDPLTPDPENTIWFPESKTAAAGDIATRQMTLPVNTLFYANKDGQPVKGTAQYLHARFRAEVWPANVEYIEGEPVYFTLLLDGDTTRRVWAKLHL